MTDKKQRLLDLANRCENGISVDRVLDANIAIEMTPSTETGCARRVIIWHGAKPGDYEWSDIYSVSLRTSRHFTSSVKDAMTLLPEGGWERYVLLPDHSTLEVPWRLTLKDGSAVYGNAKYPARSIAAACLRAHASMGEG